MLPGFTDLSADISRAALILLSEHWNTNWPVRMVGISLANLVKRRIKQMDLFGDKDQQRKIELARDQVRKQFGKAAVLRAASLSSSPKSRQDR
jgi:DNA polymerase-4